MFKLLRFAKRLNRLCDTLQNIKFNNNLQINSLVNNQLHLNYCSEALKQTKIELPGLEPDINVELLTNNDPDLLKKLQIIILEVDVMRQQGQKIPESQNIKQQHWKELLNKPSISQRRKYLHFLWTNERKRENQRSKREEAKIERENRPEYVDDGHIRYGLNHNTFLIRIYDTTINMMFNSKLINAHKFGQPIVIDVGYDKDMTTRECYNCAKQIMLAFSDNRIHDEPFDLHLCNVDKNSPTIQALSRHIATLYEPWFPLSVHEESYHTVKFPSLELERKQLAKSNESSETSPPNNDKRKLIYLTPHCREEMKHFDHDAIYIIGGIVDKINQEPLSLAKAKKEGLKMQKLPLDRYLTWGSGSGKSLTINHMMNILLDLRRTGDWKYALRHVPKRKILEPSGISRISDLNALRFDKNPTRSNKNPTKRPFVDRKRTNTKDFIHELLKN